MRFLLWCAQPSMPPPRVASPSSDSSAEGREVPSPSSESDLEVRVVHSAPKKVPQPPRGSPPRPAKVQGAAQGQAKAKCNFTSSEASSEAVEPKAKPKQRASGLSHQATPPQHLLHPGKATAPPHGSKPKAFTPEPPPPAFIPKPPPLRKLASPAQNAGSAAVRMMANPKRPPGCQPTMPPPSRSQETGARPRSRSPARAASARGRTPFRRGLLSEKSSSETVAAQRSRPPAGCPNGGLRLQGISGAASQTKKELTEAQKKVSEAQKIAWSAMRPAHGMHQRGLKAGDGLLFSSWRDGGDWSWWCPRCRRVMLYEWEECRVCRQKRPDLQGGNPSNAKIRRRSMPSSSSSSPTRSVEESEEHDSSPTHSVEESEEPDLFLQEQEEAANKAASSSAPPVRTVPGKSYNAEQLQRAQALKARDSSNFKPKISAPAAVRKTKHGNATNDGEPVETNATPRPNETGNHPVDELADLREQVLEKYDPWKLLDTPDDDSEELVTDDDGAEEDPDDDEVGWGIECMEGMAQPQAPPTHAPPNLDMLRASQQNLFMAGPTVRGSRIWVPPRRGTNIRRAASPEGSRASGSQDDVGEPTRRGTKTRRAASPEGMRASGSPSKKARTSQGACHKERREFKLALTHHGTVAEIDSQKVTQRLAHMVSSPAAIQGILALTLEEYEELRTFKTPEGRSFFRCSEYFHDMAVIGVTPFVNEIKTLEKASFPVDPKKIPAKVGDIPCFSKYMVVECVFSEKMCGMSSLRATWLARVLGSCSSLRSEHMHIRTHMHTLTYPIIYIYIYTQIWSSQEIPPKE